MNRLSDIVDTYSPNVTVPPSPSNPFPKPKDFTPPGYPLSSKGVTNYPSMIALAGVSAILYVSVFVVVVAVICLL